MTHKGQKYLTLALCFGVIVVAGTYLARQYTEPLSAMLYTQVGLKSDLKNIQKHYGVSVKTKLTLANYPSNWTDNNKLNDDQTKVVLTEDINDFSRFVRISKPELEKYPSSLIRNNIKKIYCLDDFYLYGSPAGGTYSVEKHSIYLLNKASSTVLSTKLTITQIFHHELSSILKKNYAFDDTVWRQTHGEGFLYEIDKDFTFHWMRLNGYIDDIPDEVLFKRGLLSTYSESGVEDDFNTYAETIFTQPEKIKRLIKQYPLIKRKYEVFKDFYLGIDAGFAPVFAAVDG